MNNYEFINFIENKCNIKDLKSFDEEKVSQIINQLSFYRIDSLNEAKFIGKSTYSAAFRIGNYVLKIGMPKINYDIINCDFLIKTFFRTDFSVKQGTLKRIIGVEFQAYAEHILDISEEKMFSIYCCLRDEYGLIWQDVKKENLGVYDNRIVIVDVDEFYNKKFNIKTLMAKKFDEMYERNNIK